MAYSINQYLGNERTDKKKNQNIFSLNLKLSPHIFSFCSMTLISSEIASNVSIGLRFTPENFIHRPNFKNSDTIRFHSFSRIGIILINLESFVDFCSWKIYQVDLMFFGLLITLKTFIFL